MAFDGSTISFELSSSSRFEAIREGRSRVFLKEGRRKSSHGSRRTAEEGRAALSGECNSFELKPISTHGRSHVSWFLRFQMRACVMQARLLDICLTCLLGQCILEGGVVPSRMRRRRFWPWISHEIGVVSEERSFFERENILILSSCWRYFEIQFQRNSKKKKKNVDYIIIGE